MSDIKIDDSFSLEKSDDFFLTLKKVTKRENVVFRFRENWHEGDEIVPPNNKIIVLPIDF